MQEDQLGHVSIVLRNAKLSELLCAAFPGSVRVMASSVTSTPEDFSMKVSGCTTLFKFLVFLTQGSSSSSSFSSSSSSSISLSATTQLEQKSLEKMFLTRVSSIPTTTTTPDEEQNTLYYVLVVSSPASASGDLFVKAQCACFDRPNCIFSPIESIPVFLKSVITEQKRKHSSSLLPPPSPPATTTPVIDKEKAFSMCVSALMGLEDAQLEQDEVERMLLDYGSLTDLANAGYVSYLREGLSATKAKYLNDFFKK